MEKQVTSKKDPVHFSNALLELFIFWLVVHFTEPGDFMNNIPPQKGG